MLRSLLTLAAGAFALMLTAPPAAAQYAACYMQGNPQACAQVQSYQTWKSDVMNQAARFQAETQARLAQMQAYRLQLAHACASGNGQACLLLRNMTPVVTSYSPSYNAPAYQPPTAAEREYRQEMNDQYRRHLTDAIGNPYMNK